MNTPQPIQMTTVTVQGERIATHEIAIFPDSSVELVEYMPHNSANSWYALLVDGRHYYNLVMAKFVYGRPEIAAACHQALATVEAAITALLDRPAPTPITDAAVAAALEHLADREAASAQQARERSRDSELTAEAAEEIKAEAKFFQRNANAYTKALLYWQQGIRPTLTPGGGYTLPSQRSGEPPHLLHMHGDWVCTCAAGATMHWAMAMVIGVEVSHDALQAGTVGEPGPVEEEPAPIDLGRRLVWARAQAELDECFA